MRIGILAAGMSKRMKGANKLHEKLDGKTILELSVENALSYSESVTVITGHERERTEEILSRYPVRVIHNPCYEEGQETSLRLLLSETGGDIIVTLADMPFLTPADFALAEEKLKGYFSARPFYENTAGHPVAISGDLIKLLPGEKRRIRDLLKELPHCFYEGRRENIMDIDTPEILNFLKKKQHE